MNGRKEHEIKSERRVYEKLKNWQILFFRYFLYIVKVAKGSN